MRKILMSLVMIVATVSVVAGATQAQYVDQESIPNNTVSTGTLVLTLNKSAGKPFHVTAAYPGYHTGWEYMDIFNGPYPAIPGQLPFEAYMTITKTGGSSVLWDYIGIEMRTVGNDSICANGDSDEHLIYQGLAKNFTAHTLVSTKNYWHLANEGDASGSPADNIRPGYSERICQRIGVAPSAPNSTQGLSVTFSEIVDAEQDND